jgi:hypothetical protein
MMREEIHKFRKNCYLFTVRFAMLTAIGKLLPTVIPPATGVATALMITVP